MSRYYVHDKSKTQATQLTSWSYLNQRFAIVDRQTGQTVDGATSQYAARQAAQGWNAGVYSTESAS